MWKGRVTVLVETSFPSEHFFKTKKTMRFFPTNFSAPRTDFSDIGEGIGGTNPMTHAGRTTVATGGGVSRGLMGAGAETWRGVSKRKGNLANTNAHTGLKGGIAGLKGGLNEVKQNTEQNTETTNTKKLKTDSKSEHKKNSNSGGKYGGSLLQNNINGGKYDPNDINEKGNYDSNEKGNQNEGSALSEKSNVSGKSDESVKSYSDLAPAPNGDLLPLRDVHDVFTTFEEEIDEEDDLKSKEEDLKSKSGVLLDKRSWIVKIKQDESNKHGVLLSKKGLTSKPRKKLVAQWTPKGPKDFDTRYFQLLLEMHREKKKTVFRTVADFLDHVWNKFDLNGYHYQSDEEIELMRPKGLWEPERLGEVMNSKL
jgi:hypothetical protein